MWQGFLALYSRSPCRERGLKYRFPACSLHHLVSLPVQGAWIEISMFTFGSAGRMPSLPVQGAWIEIFLSRAASTALSVAPRAGSVD